MTDYLAAQAQEIVRCDLGVRLGEPEVHKFRVAIRRLRSTLRVFGPVFEPERVAQLEPELVWLAGLLGEVRDRDVLRERLAGQVAELPAEMVLGPVAAHIETTLLLERSDHLGRLTEAMDGERYAALVRQLMQWRAAPPLTKSARKPAAAAERYVERAESKVRQRLRRPTVRSRGCTGPEGREALPVRGRAERSGARRSATKTVKSTTKLQTQLGEHQDSVVSAAFLRRMGAEAGAGEGQNGFTYGLAAGEEWHRAEQVSRSAGRRWGRSIARRSGGLGSAHTQRGEHRAGEGLEGSVDQAVVGPFAALVAGQESGFDQDPHVVGHRRLGHPTGEVRSQMQASPSPAPATRLSSRSRVGSATALSSPANLSASAVASTGWSDGAQQSHLDRRERGSVGHTPSLTHPLTPVDACGRIITLILINLRRMDGHDRRGAGTGAVPVRGRCRGGEPGAEQRLRRQLLWRPVRSVLQRGGTGPDGGIRVRALRRD